MEFVESFMKFSFDDGNLFRIEKDELVQSLEGRKACECVVLLNENVAFIEAKASSPNSKNKDKFNEFITEIKQKFEDSLQLFTEMKTKVYGDEAYQRLPPGLQHASDDKNRYKIYLIIHGHKEEWLIGLLDALREALRDVVKKWNMRDSNIKVLNEKIALENKLIVAYIPVEELSKVRQGNGNMDETLALKWFSEHT
jgi:hypothetical protein